MADQKLKIIIETLLKDKGLNKAKKSLKELNEAGKKNKQSLEGMKQSWTAMLAPIAAVGGALFAAKKAFDFAAAGAQIQKTQAAFEALSASIGRSSEGMVRQLRDATANMVSDTELMASASRFLSMGLATTGDEAAELARVAVTLGSAMGKNASAAMEEFALLMANQSIPRLDTFGISAGRVRTRIKELRDANVELTREGAFNQAVMEEAALSMEKLGDAVPVDAFTQFETSLANITEAMQVNAAEAAGPAVGRFAKYIQLVRDVTEGVERGAISQELWLSVLNGTIPFTNNAIRAYEALAKRIELNDAAMAALVDEADDADIKFRTFTGTVEGTSTALEGQARTNIQAARVLKATEKAAGDLADRQGELADVTDESAEAANEEAAALARLKLDAFTGALEDTGKPLKFFNETLEELGPQMVFFGGRTADQNRVLGEAETKYKNLDRAIVDMRIGLDGLGLTEAERGEKIGEMVAQQQQLIPLMDELSGIYGTANTVVQEATVNEEALTSALYDQLTALGLTPNELALAAGALGLYNEEQLAAALQAAALTAKIAELGQKVADGDITVMGALDSLKLYAGDLQTVDGSALGASQSINEAREEAGLLQGGSPYDATASVSVSGIGQLREAIGLARALQSFGAAGFDVGAGGDRTPGRQHGGPVAGGSPYIVGERGPELFVPNSSGNIVPNNQMNMGGLTVNVTVSSGNPGMIGSEVGKAVQDMVLGSGMRG